MLLSLPRRCVCEFIGTYFLILIGCGAISVDVQTGMLTHVGVATVWGLIVMTMIYSIGDLSGAHINPAVSIAFASVGRFPVKDAVAYCVVQCAGAVAGALSIRAVLGVGEDQLGATMTILSPGGAWFVEAMMSLILMWVVMGVSTGAKEKSITAGLAVGAVIAMEAFVAGPLTKASMNPARSLGPAIASGYYTHLWIYLSAPIVGALIGGWGYRWIRVIDETKIAGEVSPD